jgi:DNA-binding XRE family transcriptional regulator
MSQSTLAHLVGVTAQTIMRLEQGKRCPHQITVHRLATALGTTVDELLEGADRESLWR